MSALIVAAALFAFLLAAVALIDARTRRIPDALNALIVGAGLVVTLILGRDFHAALIGVFAGYAALFLLNLLFRLRRGADGLGMGDAKLLAGLGAWIGWSGLPFVALLASAAGLVFVALRRVRAGAAEMSGAIAFGPFLALAGFVVWLVLVFA